MSGGIDPSAALEVARTRLPAWAGRSPSGTADPGGLLAVGGSTTSGQSSATCPPDERGSFARRLPDDLVAPRGRLIVCSYPSTRIPMDEPPSPGEELAAWGWPVAGEAAAVDPWTGKVFARIAWVAPD